MRRLVRGLPNLQNLCRQEGLLHVRGRFGLECRVERSRQLGGWFCSPLLAQRAGRPHHVASDRNDDAVEANQESEEDGYVELLSRKLTDEYQDQQHRADERYHRTNKKDQA